MTETKFSSTFLDFSSLSKMWTDAERLYRDGYGVGFHDSENVSVQDWDLWFSYYYPRALRGLNQTDLKAAFVSGWVGPDAVELKNLDQLQLLKADPYFLTNMNPKGFGEENGYLGTIFHPEDTWCCHFFMALDFKFAYFGTVLEGEK